MEALPLNSSIAPMIGCLEHPSGGHQTESSLNAASAPAVCHRRQAGGLGSQSACQPRQPARCPRRTRAGQTCERDRHRRRTPADAGLVEQADRRTSASGVFLILGQSRATHWRIACSSRSCAWRVGALQAPVQAMALHPPHVGGVVAHPGDAPDDGGDAVKGPQVALEPVGLGALQ